MDSLRDGHRYICNFECSELEVFAREFTDSSQAAQASMPEPARRARENVEFIPSQSRRGNLVEGKRAPQRVSQINGS